MTLSSMAPQLMLLNTETDKYKTDIAKCAFDEQLCKGA